MLEETGALTIVRRVADLEGAVAECLESAELRRRRGAAGRRMLDENRGALDRLLRLVIPLMEDRDEIPARRSVAG